jgi:hypothetical protein
LTSQTKAQRSAAAKKAAATRKRNEVKERGADLKKAAGGAVDAARDLGGAAVGVARDTAKSVSKRVGS